jgi:hypothetical protein
MPGGSFAVSTLRSTVHSLRWADWLMLAEAAAALATARIAILLLPFKVVARRLGTRMRESPSFADDADRPTLRRVSWAIAAVSRRAPWRCKCLEQGVAASGMLRRRRIPSTFYFGVARTDGVVAAHAWVRSGDYYVTGGSEREHFQVVSTFAREERK